MRQHTNKITESQTDEKDAHEDHPITVSVPERPRTIQSNVDGTKLICAFEHRHQPLKRARIEALQIVRPLDDVAADTT